ncbi:MAG: transposase [Hyphomicrobium sp.]
MAALKRLDRQVKQLAGKSDICRLLMTAPGVGPVTSLCFSATIDDPKRFLITPISPLMF